MDQCLYSLESFSHGGFIFLVLVKGNTGNGFVEGEIVTFEHYCGRDS